MVFNSFAFLVFFALVFPTYWLLRKRLRLQNILLLVSSYIFYGWWDERFLILIAISTALDYICGFGAGGDRVSRKDMGKTLGFVLAIGGTLWLVDNQENMYVLVASLAYATLLPAAVNLLDRLQGEQRRKAYVALSVITNLGILGFFKYADFFADSMADLLQLVGVEANFTLLNIVLPVGISFYTFQTMSYTIDIYRRQMKPTHLFLEHATFVAFFPQLVAGPIERGRNLIPQFLVRREFSLDALKSGSLLFLWGLYKKIVIADNLAPISDAVFSNPEAYSAGGVLVGILAFTFQIYCDFSGYTDMARGAARCLGFELMLNFNIPYASRTPSEFWRRWHISLSSWLRDYLYIPLGGNKGSGLFTYRNLFLTMLLGGLWHGASWTFIFWGAFHGIILVIYRMLNIERRLYELRTSRALFIFSSLFSWAVMFILTMIGWVFFRAQSMEDVGLIYQQVLFEGGFQSSYWQDLFFYITPLILVQIYQLVSRELEFLYHARPLVRLNLILFLVMSILLFGAETGAEFIYFDF